MTKKVLTQEEQDYWRILAKDKMYEALKGARTTLNVLQPDGSAILRQIDETLALAEGRIE